MVVCGVFRVAGRSMFIGFIGFVGLEERKVKGERQKEKG